VHKNVRAACRVAAGAAVALSLGVAMAAPSPAQRLISASGGLTVARALSIPWVACRREGPPLSTTSLTEEVLVLCRIPGGAMGPDGCVEVRTVWQSLVADGSPRIRFTNATVGNAGVSYSSGGVTAGSEYRDGGRLICNVGSVTAQQGFAAAIALFTRSSAVVVTSPYNTGADTWVGLRGSVAAGGTLVLSDYSVVVYPSAGG
jgi:hypothetical protein